MDNIKKIQVRIRLQKIMNDDTTEEGDKLEFQLIKIKRLRRISLLYRENLVSFKNWFV